MDELEQRCIDSCREFIRDFSEGYCLRIKDFPNAKKMIIECKGYTRSRKEYDLGNLIIIDGKISEISEFVRGFKDYIEKIKG